MIVWRVIWGFGERTGFVFEVTEVACYIVVGVDCEIGDELIEVGGE